MTKLPENFSSQKGFIALLPILSVAVLLLGAVTTTYLALQPQDIRNYAREEEGFDAGAGGGRSEESSREERPEREDRDREQEEQRKEQREIRNSQQESAPKPQEPPKAEPPAEPPKETTVNTNTQPADNQSAAQETNTITFKQLTDPENPNINKQPAEETVSQPQTPANEEEAKVIPKPEEEKSSQDILNQKLIADDEAMNEAIVQGEKLKAQLVEEAAAKALEETQANALELQKDVEQTIKDNAVAQAAEENLALQKTIEAAEQEKETQIAKLPHKEQEIELHNEVVTAGLSTKPVISELTAPDGSTIVTFSDGSKLVLGTDPTTGLATMETIANPFAKNQTTAAPIQTFSDGSQLVMVSNPQTGIPTLEKINPIPATIEPLPKVIEEAEQEKETLIASLLTGQVGTVAQQEINSSLPVTLTLSNQNTNSTGLGSSIPLGGNTVGYGSTSIVYGNYPSKTDVLLDQELQGISDATTFVVSTSLIGGGLYATAPVLGPAATGAVNYLAYDLPQIVGPKIVEVGFTYGPPAIQLGGKITMAGLGIKLGGAVYEEASVDPSQQQLGKQVNNLGGVVTNLGINTFFFGQNLINTALLTSSQLSVVNKNSTLSLSTPTVATPTKELSLIQKLQTKLGVMSPVEDITTVKMALPVSPPKKGVGLPADWPSGPNLLTIDLTNLPTANPAINANIGIKGVTLNPALKLSNPLANIPTVPLNNKNISSVAVDLRGLSNLQSPLPTSGGLPKSGPSSLTAILARSSGGMSGAELNAATRQELEIIDTFFLGK